MKYADKAGAALTLVIGDNELETGKAALRDMKSGEQSEVALSELSSALYKARQEQALSSLTDSVAGNIGI